MTVEDEGVSADLRVADDDSSAFKTSGKEERLLLETITEAERGETVRADDLIGRLRR